ncbi:MAG TPA: ATP-binding protein [Verrucomicrobiae bacterium]|jgi:two-component system phosphate regulon sensor histidine kinase PhoR|nr:ATP-binding protein [Verrucomicrobiae bacterium]
MWWWIVLAVATALAAALARGEFLRRQLWRQRDALAEASRAHSEALAREREKIDSQFQARQQALFNSMLEGIILLDTSGRIQMTNDSLRKFFDVSTDIRGMTIMEAFRWHELAALSARLQREKKISGAELEIHRARHRFWEVNAAIVADHAGAEQGQLLVFHEVTRLKELENMRSEFVGNVSHELRTPLSLIKGFTETLLDGASGDPQMTERFLRKIEKHSDRLLFLIEDLLAISHLESGQVALNVEQLDLHALAQRVLEDLAARAAARKMTLENQIAPRTIVWGDSDRLQQVLFNLADNALKYGRSEGHVAVGAREVGGEKTEVFVSDDGPGIPPESIDRVFERFYRVDRARSRESGGTGLGLAIVKHIVQAHGGEAWVRSELQKGATFYFTLPQKPAPPPPVEIVG